MRKVERDNSWKAENLSGKPEVENLKKPQISAIIYIQGERKVTHQNKSKTYWVVSYHEKEVPI